MNQEFEMKFNAAELNLVIGALAKQPYEMVSGLVEKLIAEARKQQSNTGQEAALPQ